MFGQKGHLLEIPVAKGFLTLITTANPLEWTVEERALVFTIVDIIQQFKQEHIGK